MGLLTMTNSWYDREHHHHHPHLLHLGLGLGLDVDTTTTTLTSSGLGLGLDVNTTTTSSTCFRTEPLRICHPTNSVKALKNTRSTHPKAGEIAQWLHAPRLRALLSLDKLSDCYQCIEHQKLNARNGDLFNRLLQQHAAWPVTGGLTLSFQRAWS